MHLHKLWDQMILSFIQFPWILFHVFVVSLFYNPSKSVDNSVGQDFICISMVSSKTAVTPVY